MPLDRRQHLRPHRGQDRRIVPVRLGHHVVQRLMFGLHMGGSSRAAIGSMLLRSPGSSRPVQ